MRISDSSFIAALCAAPVIPVLTVADIDVAEPLALALARAGLLVVEVTLRTTAALEVIRRMKNSAGHLLIGAGTVLNAGDARASVDAGADFVVTPGATSTLTSALRNLDVLAIPGIASASEAMARREEGFTLLKLFPAETVGGVSLLRALAAPLPDLKFIPTGGIGPANAADYLALPNVAGVGGSWIATPMDMETCDWSAIENRARASMALAQFTDRQFSAKSCL